MKVKWRREVDGGAATSLHPTKPWLALALAKGEVELWDYVRQYRQE